ncbi:hypothetical protein HBI37_231290 [Parastagonospora nodorum]|nr:hypothetical protein HBI37_231290 [Parastagonospora nodorum]
MTDSPRARTPINLSAVLYEQSAAQPGLPAEVSNMDLNFVPSVAFIPDVHIADSLRARTPINLSAVSNIDLNFVLSVAFIPDVHMADSLRARTPINPSAVLYEQAAAQTGLPAEVSNISPRARTLINLSAVLYEQADARSGLSAEVSIIDLDFVLGVAFDAMGNVELTGDLLGDADCVNNNNNNVAPTSQFSPTALLNLRSLASKRPALSGSDLNCRPSPAKRIKTDEDCKKSTHRQGFNGSSSLELQKISNNIEELICVSKVKHTYVQAYTVSYPDPKKYLGNSSQQGRIKVSFRRARNNRNNLNIMVTDPTSREFGRAYNIGKFYKGKNIQLLRPVFELQRYDYYNLQDRLTPREPGSIYVLRSVNEIRANVTDVFDTVVSKSDEVPTREPSTLYFMWDKEQDYSAEEHDYRKFYRLVITSEDTHCKQTIKKAYIISPERASLILFMT